MTDEFRQKLLNWFCSVAILMAATALGPFFFWFIDLREMAELGISLNFDRIIGPLVEAIMLFPLMIPIFLIWHFFDFIQRGTAEVPWSIRVTSYQHFLGIMTVAIVLFVLMDLGFWQYNSCDQLPQAYFVQCVVRPSWWLMAPWFAAMALALMLCVAKGIFSIRSLLVKVA